MGFQNFKREFFMRLALASYNQNEDKRNKIYIAQEIEKEIELAQQILNRIEDNKGMDVNRLLFLEKKIKKLKSLINKIEGKKETSGITIY